MNIADEIVATATKYVGQRELPGNSGFVDKDFHAAMVQAGWQKGWAWCACFVEKIYREVYARHNPRFLAYVSLMITPSALQTWRNFERAGFTSDVPTPGAIVLWRMGKGWQGHAGIVYGVPAGAKEFLSIEGNSSANGEREGTQVVAKARMVDFTQRQKGLNLLGFVPPV